MMGKEFDKKAVHKGLEFKEMFLPINDQAFFVGEHTTILGEIGTYESWQLSQL